MSKQTLIIIIIVCSVALFVLSKKAVKLIKAYMTRQEFINTFAPVVQRVAKGTGLFPSLFLAQAILESNNGNSTLTQLHNNFFGIKASKAWTGKTAVMKTTEYINGQPVKVEAKFRKYDAPESSFLDRVLFLKQNKRYTNAGVFSAKTPFEQAEALQKAGYATDPKYKDLLGSLIKKYDLQRLD